MTATRTANPDDAVLHHPQQSVPAAPDADGRTGHDRDAALLLELGDERPAAPVTRDLGEHQHHPFVVGPGGLRNRLLDALEVDDVLLCQTERSRRRLHRHRHAAPLLERGPEVVAQAAGTPGRQSGVGVHGHREASSHASRRYDVGCAVAHARHPGVHGCVLRACRV